jgi:hypothetical protein
MQTKKILLRRFVMSKKLYSLISTLPIILAVLVFSGKSVMSVQAGKSDQAILSKGNDLSVICAVDTVLMHRAQLLRLDFALSDGRGNALNLQRYNPYLGADGCSTNLRRLEYNLSDGGRVHNAGGSAGESLLKLHNESNLKRLSFTLSDGRGDAFEFETDGAMNTNGYNLRRLEFSLNDGGRLRP